MWHTNFLGQLEPWLHKSCTLIGQNNWVKDKIDNGLLDKPARLRFYFSKSTKITKNTETAMLSDYGLFLNKFSCRKQM